MSGMTPEMVAILAEISEPPAILPEVLIAVYDLGFQDACDRSCGCGEDRTPDSQDRDEAIRVLLDRLNGLSQIDYANMTAEEIAAALKETT